MSSSLPTTPVSTPPNPSICRARTFDDDVPGPPRKVAQHGVQPVRRVRDEHALVRLRADERRDALARARQEGLVACAVEPVGAALDGVVEPVYGFAHGARERAVRACREAIVRLR